MNTFLDNIPPASEKVNIECLVGAFTGTTTSYKYLILRTILNKIADSFAKPESFTGEISYEEIRTEMLLNAWFPSKFYLLNFGVMDQIPKALAEIDNEIFKHESDRITSFYEINGLFNKYSEEINKLASVAALTVYPITRFLTPWFSQELVGLKDAVKNDLIIKYSNEKFEETIPLYKIIHNEKIIIHQNWIDYLRLNLNVIVEWLNMHWLRFLQNRNPHVPSIVSKLWAPPEQRGSILHFRKFWDPIIDEGFSCIYTNEKIELKNYDLDHFVPWSWIGHNQLWNLVPISKELNSSKGARLPNNNFIPNLANAHYQLIDYNERKNIEDWHKTIDDYIGGLHIDIDTLTNQEKLINAYTDTINPQLALAIKHGFKNWEIKQ